MACFNHCEKHGAFTASHGSVPCPECTPVITAFEQWRIKYWRTSVTTELKFQSAYDAGRKSVEHLDVSVIREESADELAEMKEQYLKYFNLHHTLAVNEAGIKGILCDALKIEHYQHDLYELSQMVTKELIERQTHIKSLGECHDIDLRERDNRIHQLVKSRDENKEARDRWFTKATNRQIDINRMGKEIEQLKSNIASLEESNENWMMAAKEAARQVDLLREQLEPDH